MVPPSEDALKGINILLQCAVSGSGLPDPHTEEGLELLEGVRYLHTLMIFFETISDRYLTPPLVLLEEIAKTSEDLKEDVYKEIIMLLSIAEGAKIRSDKEILPHGKNGNGNGKPQP